MNDPLRPQTWPRCRPNSAQRGRILAIVAVSLGLLVLTGANAQAATISGRVFEDKNYGGGAGRSFLDAAGVGRANVRIELYGSSNAFLGSTLTDAAGSYTLTVATPGTYFVRPVNSTVRSARNGSNGTEVG